jgi:hypothetical protein
VVRHADARVARRRFDGELAAEHLVLVGERELQVFPLSIGAFADDLLDGEVARVQHQLRGLRIEPLERVGRAATELPVVEVDLQFKREVVDADLVGLREGVFVDVGYGFLVGSGHGGGVLGRRVGGRRGVARTAGGEGGGEAQGQHRITHGRTGSGG